MATGRVDGRDVRLRRTHANDRDALLRLVRSPAFSGWAAAELPDETVGDMYLGGRSPDVECFFVEYRGVVVGFAQYHVADDGSDGGGMDMILMPEARGQGIGSAVVEQMVSRVRDERGWRRFTVDPDVSNERGVEFWRRVGFVPERIVRGDGGREPYWIMARRFHDSFLVGT